MKRLLGIMAAGVLPLCLAGCGGPKNNTATTLSAAAKIKQRVYVTNQFASFGTASGTVVIVDAEKDQIGSAGLSSTVTGAIVGTPTEISIGGRPGFMLLSPDRKITLIFDQVSESFDIIDNTLEQFVNAFNLGDAATSAVLLPDNKTGYAALRNTGQVALFDYIGGTITKKIPVPTVRTLVLSHNGNKLLAFSDDSNTAALIDVAANTATILNSATFDRPVSGVFSSDDGKAYILNCGRECGGTLNGGRVSVLDVASGSVSGSVDVSAGSVALLDGGTLYVAGTQGTTGKLDVLTVSGASLTVSKTGVVIGDGFHNLMTLASNNRLFIGARTCNNVSSGCLSIYNTSAGTAVIGSAKGDVTSIQPIAGRNVVYVAEGGEVRIYDTTKDAETSGVAIAPIDIVGKAIDIKAIDQQ